MLNYLFQCLLPLNSLFSLHLVIVEFSKVVYDNGDGERHDQDTGYGTTRANQFAKTSGGMDVAIAHRGHRDDRPPEARGDGGEARVLLVLLSEVTQTGEYQDTHGKEQHKQAKLFVTILQCEGY